MAARQVDESSEVEEKKSRTPELLQMKQMAQDQGTDNREKRKETGRDAGFFMVRNNWLRVFQTGRLFKLFLNPFNEFPFTNFGQGVRMSTEITQSIQDSSHA